MRLDASIPIGIWCSDPSAGLAATCSLEYMKGPLNRVWQPLSSCMMHHDAKDNACVCAPKRMSVYSAQLDAFLHLYGAGDELKL